MPVRVRRKATTISILFVFLLLQYGKVATYIYCKWQSEIVQKLKDCDCETHLSTMFSDDTNHGVSPTGIKEVVSEYIVELPPYFITLTHPVHTNHFAEYDSPLFKRSITPAYRPPSL